MGTEEDNSVRKFLDRAGLIMRDGRWFSTLDQRYLTPLFTNSVASRKQEERKAMRRSGVVMAAAEGVAGGSAATRWSAGESGRNSVQFEGGLGPLGSFDERDADVLDEEDDDDEGAFVKSLDGNSTSHSTGGSAPVRRSSSRAASDDETPNGSRSRLSKSNSNSNNNSATGASRISGAFAPHPQESRAEAGASVDWTKQRRSDDLGPL